MQRKRQARRQSERHRELTRFDAVASQEMVEVGSSIRLMADAVVPDGDENTDDLPKHRLLRDESWWRILIGKTCNESWIKPNSEHQKFVVTRQTQNGGPMIKSNENQEPEL